MVGEYEQYLGNPLWEGEGSTLSREVRLERADVDTLVPPGAGGLELGAGSRAPGAGVAASSVLSGPHWKLCSLPVAETEGSPTSDHRALTHQPGASTSREAHVQQHLPSSWVPKEESETQRELVTPAQTVELETGFEQLPPGCDGHPGPDICFHVILSCCEKYDEMWQG